MTTAHEAAERQKLRFKTRSDNPKDVWGIPFGIPKLDRITTGIQLREEVDGIKFGDNDLISIIADTGAGKSSIAGFIGRNVAQYFKDNELDLEVRYVTLEMSPEKLQDRMAAAESGVPLHRIKTGQWLSEEQKKAYYKAVDRLADLPIRYIGEDEATDLHLMGKAMSRKVDGKACGLWILDHLHLVPGAETGDNSVASLNRVVAGLNRLSKRVAPGIVLAQMNKDALRRQDKRPQKGDIKNNTSLAQASTLILGLYREDIYVQVDIDETESPVVPAELNILKSRDGAMGCIHLDLYKDRMLWVVPDRKNE